MSDTIRLLETRVEKAVRRLRTLKEERDALTREVDTLKREVAADAADDEASGGWRDERQRVLRELRETLAELESA